MPVKRDLLKKVDQNFTKRNFIVGYLCFYGEFSRIPCGNNREFADLQSKRRCLNCEAKTVVGEAYRVILNEVKDLETLKDDLITI